jgi:hypothetical protein
MLLLVIAEQQHFLISETRDRFDLFASVEFCSRKEIRDDDCLDSPKWSDKNNTVSTDSCLYQAFPKPIRRRVVMGFMVTIVTDT